jgi:hypothetical protein
MPKDQDLQILASVASVREASRRVRRRTVSQSMKSIEGSY